MALVTYTLLSALASGLQSRFHPEILGFTFSKALAVVIVEFCVIKLGCYLLDVKNSGASGVELIGYGGYKFVGCAFPLSTHCFRCLALVGSSSLSSSDSSIWVD